jgi:hypothetical protein
LNDQFVVTRNGRDTFHDEASLKMLADGGMLSPDDLVYHPAQGRWLYAREVVEVRAELSRVALIRRYTDGDNPLVPELRANNTDAIAGFVLGLAGQVPVLGVAACVLGIWFSVRGLKRAATTRTGQGLAIAGLVLSTVLLLPAAICAAIIFAVM